MTDDRIERLSSSVRNGFNSPVICFMSDTGRASAIELLSGSLKMAATTSAQLRTQTVTPHDELTRTTAPVLQQFFPGPGSPCNGRTG